MYYLKLAQVNVPLEKIYGIRKHCTIQSEVIETRTVIPKGVPVGVDVSITKDEARAKLSDRTNTIRELPFKKGYEVTEYYITDEDGNIDEEDVVSDYTLITERGEYLADEVEQMKQLLEHLDFYTRLSAILVYERYGFLKKETDEFGQSRIYYQDERQKLCFDETNQIKNEPL